MPKVLVTAMTLAHLEGPWRQLLRQSGMQEVFPPRPVQLSEQELLDELPGIAATVAGSEPYTRKVFQSRPELKVIARVGVGYDAVDVAAATEHGVAVTIAPGTNQDAVAEQTFALMLALAKDLIAQHQGVKAGVWPRQTTLPLRGRTLGIVGLGRIGKAVAIRGACFGMPMLAYEPFPDTAFAARYNITLVPLERLFREADYVSLHVPLTPESRDMINRKSLALMKPTAFLVNTARGALVNEADLFEALKEKRIAGAALDVLQEEPPAKDHPLFQFPNVVLTPHAAGVDLQSRDDMALSAVQAIVALSRGEWPAHQIVNPEVKARFKW